MATTATKQSKTAPKPSARQEPDASTEGAAPPVKYKRSLLKIGLLLTLLLGGAAGGAWYFLRSHEPVEATKPGAAKGEKGEKGAKGANAATAKEDSLKPPVFVKLDPFTVNLRQDDSAAQFLQVGLVLKVNGDGFGDAIKLYMPEIRNRVLLLLTSKSASDLATSEGKKTLSTEIAREILEPLAGKVPAQDLDSVLFTSFVIQ
ncbi:MAG: flagellar basal body-associated protein FliL [Burkholderiales bacterium]